MQKKSGKLYLVSTPLGNLEDVSFRAIRILKEVSLIASEDTRRASILLNHYGIKKTLVSFFDHNESRRIPQIIRNLLDGSDVAVISEAGTPLISDPGYMLVKKAAELNIEIIAIPGACAATNALVLSGLAPEPYVFLGFPPKKKSKRKKFILQIQRFNATCIIYVAARDIISVLEEIFEDLGDLNVAVCREMTKIHEETIRGNCSEVLAELNSRQGKIKGEITLVASGKSV
jgi:16S rRNA (cytidine1402-2'-O)-methyltransferase